MGFYDNMQAIATNLLGTYQQGIATLVRVSPQTPGDAERPWDKQDSTEIRVPLLAVAIPVQKKFIDGQRVIGRETQVTFAVPDLSPEPNIDDRIEYDGRLRTTKLVKRLPDAGTAVAWIFVVDD